MIKKKKVNQQKKTFEELKKRSICSDLKLIDVKEMYKDIEIAKSKEYSDGAHYKVKEFEVRNNHRIRNFIRKTVRSTINLSDTITDFIDQKIFNSDKDEEDDEEFDTRESRTF